MAKELKKALQDQKLANEQTKLQILGTLGIPLGGQRLVEVPNRPTFVYVQLRNNQNEVIQAFNNKVSPSYGLPVMVQREGNRYIVMGVDSQRYQNNWASNSPYLPRHGSAHSKLYTEQGGGDIVWVDSSQFMPALTVPSGSNGGPNVVISPYTMQLSNGSWAYAGNSGTPSLLTYKPTNNTAIMVLTYLDWDTGSFGIIVNSGSSFADTITGTSAIVPYLPTLTNPSYLPDSAIRLVSGTSSIGWDNIYDVRQFINARQNVPYGSIWGNEIGWTQTNAVQNTWYLISDADISDGQLNLITHDGSGKLTVSRAGKYLVTWAASAEVSIAGKHVQLGIAVNGTPGNDGINHFDLNLANSEIPISGNAILNMSANGTIELAIRTTDAGTPNLVIDHVNVSIYRVGI